jgi:hypothetical protein
LFRASSAPLPCSTTCPPPLGSSVLPLPPDFEAGRPTLNGLAKLLKIGGRDELTEQQARQLNFHLDSAHSCCLVSKDRLGF